MFNRSKYCHKSAATDIFTGKSNTTLPSYQITVLGSDRVGKSSIIKRFLFDSYDATYKETIEDDYRKIVTIKNQPCDVTIIDTAGYFQFPAMRKLAIQNSHGFILVYSVESIRSFTEVKRLYELILSTKNTTDVPIIIAGNKFDSSNREVSHIEISSFLKLSENPLCRHIEVSAKNDFNIKFLFHKLLTLLFANNDLEEPLPVATKRNNIWKGGSLIRRKPEHDKNHSPRLARALTIGSSHLPYQHASPLVGRGPSKSIN